MWVILIFQPLGPFIYFFVVYYPNISVRKKISVNKKASGADERLAEAETRRLDNTDSWIQYATILRERKRFGQAVNAAEKAVAKNKRSGRAQLELGLALLADGRAADAIAPLQKAVKKEDGFELGDAHYSLAMAFHSKGDLAAARDTLAALAERSSRPQYLYALAGVQIELGEKEKARATCQRIIAEAEYVPAYLKKEVKPWVRKAQKALKTMG